MKLVTYTKNNSSQEIGAVQDQESWSCHDLYHRHHGAERYSNLLALSVLNNEDRRGRQ